MNDNKIMNEMKKCGMMKETKNCVKNDDRISQEMIIIQYNGKNKVIVIEYVKLMMNMNDNDV